LFKEYPFNPKQEKNEEFRKPLTTFGLAAFLIAKIVTIWCLFINMSAIINKNLALI
jgi:Tfp pilus assembly protein PilN